MSRVRLAGSCVRRGLRALLERCCRLYLNADAHIAQILARYCTLQLEQTEMERQQSPRASTTHTLATPIFSGQGLLANFGLGGAGHAQEEERRAKLQRVMRLVAYLDDRSQFFTTYADALARRLIGRTSCSRSLEAHALALLRPSAPYELASRLNRMLVDVKVSEDFTMAFRQECAPDAFAVSTLSSFLIGGAAPSMDSHQSPALRVLVLTSGAWPISATSPQAEPLPASLASLQAQFDAFYLRANPSRQLTWLHAFSTVDVTTAYLPNDCTLRTSPSQLALLLPFSVGAVRCPLSTLAQQAQLLPGAFAAALGTLLELKILTLGGINDSQGDSSRNRADAPMASADACPPHSSSPPSGQSPPQALATAAADRAAADLAIPMTSEIVLNVAWLPPDVTNGEGVHAIDSVVPSPSKAASARKPPVRGLSADERQVLVQATIVRTLKRERTMAHAQLVAEIDRTLSNRFVPEAEAIRRGIEHLIDKEYIARHDTERGVYVYVP